MRPHTHLNPASMESLEPRLMLAADPFAGSTLLIAGPPSPASATTKSPDAGATFIPGYLNIPDFDWWYGSSPTTAGMQVAWWQYIMRGRLHDVNTSVYPGGGEQWQYGKYPSLDSSVFNVPSYSNGVVAGWAYQNSAVWDPAYSAWENESAQGHLPDSIADFLGTFSDMDRITPMGPAPVRGGTYVGNIPWGMSNFMAWDDPRTAADDSWSTQMGTIGDIAGYQNEILAGRPVHLILQNADGTVVQSVLGVGFYTDNKDPLKPVDYIEVYDTWHQGLQQWKWTDEENSGYKLSVVGGITMNVVPQAQGLTGYVALAASDATKLTVQIGLGDPEAPTWSTTAWTGANPGQNLVLTDIDLSGAMPFLSQGQEDWYVKVTDASGQSSTIMDFQIRYNGHRWFTPNSQEELVNGEATAYVQSAIIGNISGTVFTDNNGNGIDSDDLPAEGVYVYLDQNNNGLWDFNEQEVETDEFGYYEFTDLPLDTYNVRLDADWAGLTQTSPANGGWTGQLVGQSLTGINFAVATPGTIEGEVFHDADASGNWTLGDNGLEGWTVYLDSNNNGSLDTGELRSTTDSDGWYEFDNVLPGTYHIRMTVQSRYTASTTEADVVVDGSGDWVGYDFAVQAMPLADLQGTGSNQSSFTPSLLSPGQTLDSTFEIGNIGNADASDVLVRLYASTNNIITTDDVFLGEVTLASLKANSTANAVFSGALPAIIPGNYYVGIIIDPANTVFESNEDNNSAVDDNYPLLVPGISGQIWYDINSDGVRDANETPLANWTVYLDANLNNVMDPNEARTNTDSHGRYGFANVAPGTYHVAQVKPAGYTQASPIATYYTIQYQALEYYANNNFSNYKNSIADLKDDGDAFSRFLPTEVTAPGGSWDVWWDIRNAGTANAGPFRVDFYASVDDSMATTDDNYSLGYTTVPGVRADSFVDVNLSLLTFPSIPAGNYHVGIVIDSLHQVAESDESNNTGIDLDRYPLVIDNVSDLVSQGSAGSDFTPTKVNPGDRFDASWTVSNNGMADSGWFYVDFYASSNPIVTSYDYLLGRVMVPNVPANGTVNVEMSLMNFPDIPAGQYYVGAIVDPTFRVEEFSENNNVSVNTQYLLQVSGISGMEFHDINGNGVLDEGENFLPGWKVYLDENENGIYDFGERFAITDDNGQFSFTNVEPGDQTIRVMDQVGWTQTSPKSYEQDVTYVSDTLVTNVAFGATMPSKVGGYVYYDYDGNLQFAYTPSPTNYDQGLGSWDLEMWRDDNFNNKLDVDELDSLIQFSTNFGFMYNNLTYDGDFSLNGLLPGHYVIQEALVDGFVHVGPTTGRLTLDISSAHLYGNEDFGNAFPGEINGRAWHDRNADGMVDPGEEGLQGWRVYIDANDNHVFDNDEQYTYTDANGSFVLQGLRPQTNEYIVRIVKPDGWAQSWPTINYDGRSYIVRSGATYFNSLFGSYQTGSISGVVWHDMDADAVHKPLDEPGLQNWTVGLYDSNGAQVTTTLTNAQGQYAFSGLKPGQYTVRENLQDGWSQSAPGASGYQCLITSGLSLATSDFGDYQPGKITGHVYLDSNANSILDTGDQGLANWRVYLDQNLNGILDAGEDSTLTDSQGSYTFTGLIPSLYVIRQVPQAGYIQMTPDDNEYEVDVLSGVSFTDQDFGNTRYGEIHGTLWNDANGSGVKDFGEAPVAFRTVFLDLNADGILNNNEPSTVSLADGSYALLNIMPGSYTVAEVLPPMWIATSPASGLYTLDVAANQVLQNENFGSYQSGEIDGTVWKDVNRNGVFDNGEPGLAGLTVYIDVNKDGTYNPGEPSTKTLADGSYSFVQLIPGSYTVSAVLPAMWIATSPTTDLYIFNVAGGQVRKNVDFGTCQSGEINGTVWQDMNLNGIFDNGEPGLAGWTVYIDVDNDGTYNRNIDTHVQTDAQGQYSFSNLQPGVYKVRQVVKDGWTRISPTDDFYTVTISTGIFAADKNFGDDAKPVAADATFATDEDVTLSGQLVATDAENQSLQYNVVDAPARGILTLHADGSFQYAPPANWSGPVTFTYAATDSAAYSSKATVTINVAAVNDAPVATVAPLSTDEDTPLTFTLNAVDAESSFAQLAFTVPATTAHGTLTMVGHGQYRYTPEANYNGPDSFTYTVTDNNGQGISSTATVDIAVAPVNDSPVAVAAEINARQDEAIQIILSGSDLETAGADLTYIVATQPRSGTVVINGNVATFTPAAGFYGQVKFTYSVVDTGEQGVAGPATSVPAQVSVNVARRVTIDATHKGNLVLAGGKVTATLKGSGTGVLYLKYAETSNRPDILSMAFTGTAANTVITFTGDMVRTGDVTIDGSIKSFTASTMVLSGDFTASGYVGILSMNDVLAGHQITLGQSSTLTTALSFDQVTDLKVVSAASLKSLKATEWLHAGGTSSVTAPTLTKLTIPGDKKRAIAGNFQGTLNVAGALGGATIAGDMSGDWNVGSVSGALTVAGTIHNATLRSVGNIKSLTMGAVIGSNFLAGMDLGVTNHPTVAGEFISDASIGTIKVTGLPTSKIDPSIRLVQNSNFAAAKIGKATLINVEADNGSTPFGFFARNLPMHGVAGVSTSDLQTRVKAMHPGVFTDEDFVISLL